MTTSKPHKKTVKDMRSIYEYLSDEDRMRIYVYLLSLPEDTELSTKRLKKKLRTTRHKSRNT